MDWLKASQKTQNETLKEFWWHIEHILHQSEGIYEGYSAVSPK
eukprot:gene23660-9859_t